MTHKPSQLLSKHSSKLAFFAAMFAVFLPLKAQALESLSEADVRRVVAQAAQEAQSRGTPATIAVSDRVGNILAVYKMDNAPATIFITSGRQIGTGIDGLNNLITSELGTIAKAVTGAYLSSGGNAFTTRTASQIVQENFNPGERFAPGGPLFGVQFSQLACSDLSRSFFSGGDTTTFPDQFRGPKRSPLGLSADPGGLPLYKNGEAVGGVGVMADGIYGLDVDTVNIDTDIDELIAVAGQVGYEPPIDIRANRITADGKTFRYVDRDSRSLLSVPAAAPAATDANYVSVSGYFDGTPIAGTIFGTEASGVRPIAATDSAEHALILSEVDGLGGTPFLLVTGNDVPMFPISDGSATGGQQLTKADVSRVLAEGLKIAYKGRAQIRRPLNSHIQVTLSVVDWQGQVLGQVRTPDGPIFGTDVSLQKARTATFLSSTLAATQLNSGTFRSEAEGTAAALNGLIMGHDYQIPDYVAQVKAFVGPSALEDGTAFADRSGGNLSRPNYPDGVTGNGNGPLSRPYDSWSPFSTGLQLDLVVADIVEHLFFVLTGSADTGLGCTGVRNANGLNPLANGMQIFPGSVPIYKNGVLVGGIGVSGDGVDQDDMVSFLSVHNAGVVLNNGLGNAPQSIRADNLQPQGSRLRYVSCPFNAFIGERSRNVCSGK
jgi:uncharacterized protein GlcG (DUF336 family)